MELVLEMLSERRIMVAVLLAAGCCCCFVGEERVLSGDAAAVAVEVEITEIAPVTVESGR